MRAAVLMTVIWAACIVAGLVVLWDYGARPGEAGPGPTSWPVDSRNSSGQAWDLVMFVHPHCPCTHASLQELSHIVANAPARVSVRVFAFQPVNAPADWGGSRLTNAIRQIPGVRIEMDEGGKMATLFGVHASGHTMLFARDGRQVYSGGITLSRGHEGANHGRLAIEKLIAGSPGSRIQPIPVFGCRIR